MLQNPNTLQSNNFLFRRFVALDAHVSQGTEVSHHV